MSEARGGARGLPGRRTVFVLLLQLASFDLVAATPAYLYAFGGRGANYADPAAYLTSARGGAGFHGSRLDWWRLRVVVLACDRPDECST